MALEFYNIETLKNQFHTRSVSFNNFKGITEKDIERIKGNVKRHASSIQKTYRTRQIAGLDTYAQTLRYLNSPTVHMDYKTFDEKALHLILAVDPDFITYKTLLATPITTQTDISEAKDDKERKALEEKRKNELHAYGESVRNQLGVYDSNFIKYEKILISTLFKTEGFVSDIKASYIQPLIQRAELVKNISKVTPEDIERLRQVAISWNTQAKDPKDLNSLAYNLLKRYKDMKIQTVEEQVILFILIADPNLDLLRIFEEESTYQEVKRRANEELGFYGKGLINVEKQYHDKFEPDKKISTWTI